MLETVLTVASFCGLTFLIKDSSIFERPRQWIINRSKFMLELLSCSFCTGFHSGWAVFLITQPLDKWQWRAALLYCLASAALSFVFDVTTQALEKYIHDANPTS